MKVGYSVGEAEQYIKYSMRGLIYDVNYCECDIGKILANDISTCVSSHYHALQSTLVVVILLLTTLS